MDCFYCFYCFFSWAHPIFAYDISGDYAVHYRYGKLYWNGVMDKLGVYPRVEPTRLDYYDYYDDLSAYAVFQYYTISKNESQYNQDKNKIYFHLSVHQKKNIVAATVVLSNKSQRSYFVHRLTLPLDVNGGPYSSLCSGVFIPIMDNIQLDFLKKTKCSFGEWKNKSVWHEILPGKELSFDVTLNDYYAFLPGIHRYNIGTVEFTIVNQEWFTEQYIYEYFLSIMNWRAERECTNPIDKITYGIEKWRVWRICGPYSGLGLFQDFLARFGYHGGNDNIFKIRSNQVVVTIDGDRASPPYSLRNY